MRAPMNRSAFDTTFQQNGRVDSRSTSGRAASKTCREDGWCAGSVKRRTEGRSIGQSLWNSLKQERQSTGFDSTPGGMAYGLTWWMSEPWYGAARQYSWLIAD